MGCITACDKEPNDEKKYMLTGSPGQSPVRSFGPALSENIIESYQVGVYMPAKQNDYVAQKWQNQLLAVEQKLKRTLDDIPLSISQLPTSFYDDLSTSQEAVTKEYPKEQYKSMYQTEETNDTWKLSKCDQRKLLQKYGKTYRCVVTYDDLVVQFLASTYKQQFQQKYIFIARELLVMGPPARLRWSSWKAVMLDNNIFIKCNRYELTQEENNECMDLIHKELHRTLVEHRFFHEHDIGQNQLGRVLAGISNSFESLKYCQGMNFLVGYFLIVSGGDEILTYQCFLTLLLDPKHLYYYVFAQCLPLLQFMIYLIDMQIRKYLPDLVPYLKDFPASLWSQKYILTMFLDVVSITNSLRLWDYMLVRGALPAVVEVTLSILSLIESEIKHNPDELRIYEILTSNLNSLDFGLVVYKARYKYQVTSNDILSALSSFTLKRPNVIDETLLVMLELYDESSSYQARCDQMKKLLTIE